MSSHREAPEISQDPVADNTDTYAFVSPDRPDTVTIISNYIPLEAAAAGPNLAYEFNFTNHVINGKTFLYNTGPITSIGDSTFNRRQTYSVALLKGKKEIADRTSGSNPKPVPQVIGRNLASPPCNIGPSSTPNYPALVAQAIHTIKGGVTVFAGQRNDGFFADLGA